MGPLDAIKTAVVLIVGLALGWGASSLYAATFTIPAAYDDGHAAGTEKERRLWEKAQREAREAAETDRIRKQERVDRVESDYHRRTAARDAQIADLETRLQSALKQEQDDASQAPPAAAGGAPVCRPAVPRRLRDILAPIGRGDATPRHGPAVASPALR